MNRKFEHVFVIGIDGAGAFINKANTPEIDRIFSEGAYTFEALSSRPTISGECWGSMLLGVSPRVHNLTNGIVSSKPFDEDSPLETIFKRVRKKYPDAVLSSFCNWNPINSGIVEESVGVISDTADDEELTDKIVEHIKDKKPDFMFIQFDNVDGSGHTNGYGSDEYLKSINTVDKLVGRVFDSIVEAGIEDSSLVMSIADHGGYGRGHGGWTEDEKNVFFMARGNGVKKGKIEEMNIRDLAAIVLYALGVETPKYNEDGWTSQLPHGIFEGDFPEYNSYVSYSITRETKPMPEIGDKKHLYNFIDKDKLKVYLNFESSHEDVTGNYKTTVNGNIKYYSAGVMGECVEVGNRGYITVEDLKLGTGNFSVGIWVMYDSNIGGETAIWSNKHWYPLHNKGIGVGFTEGNVGLRAGNSENDIELIHYFYENFTKGWVHTFVNVNRDENYVDFYCDFKKSKRAYFFEGYFDKDNTLDAFNFNIGNDGIGEINRTIFFVDDFMLFEGNLTDAEIEKLGQYYNG